jgi:hypothetical protein
VVGCKRDGDEAVRLTEAKPISRSTVSGLRPNCLGTVTRSCASRTGPTDVTLDERVVIDDDGIDISGSGQDISGNDETVEASGSGEVEEYGTGGVLVGESGGAVVMLLTDVR